MTVGEAVSVVEARLSAVSVDTARLDAQMLVAHTLGADRSHVLAHLEDEFPAIAELERLCERREAREPLAYILGWREFYGRRFFVNPDVLIPRQETETLVEAALAEKHAKDVLDIGTGSGCIAITLALEKPAWRVAAVELSTGALEVAQQNAGMLGAKVWFVHSDLFKHLRVGQFDLIVCNPPYVATGDPLPPEVRDYEPHKALYAGPDGLSVYRRLAERAHAFLRPSGALMVEVGDGQSEAVQRLFEEHGWHVERTVDDLGGTPRVVVARPLTVRAR